VLGFITTVSLTANTHCMTDGLTLACLAPYAPESSLTTHVNRRAYQTKQCYVVCYQWFKRALMTKGALHTLNQMVNRLVKCVRVARSPDRRLKLT